MQREISSWVSFLFLLPAFQYKTSGKMGDNKCKGWANQSQVDQLSFPAANGRVYKVSLRKVSFRKQRYWAFRCLLGII